MRIDEIARHTDMLALSAATDDSQSPAQVAT